VSARSVSTPHFARWVAPFIRFVWRDSTLTWGTRDGTASLSFGRWVPVNVGSAAAPINRQVEPRTDHLTALRFSRFQEPGGWERRPERREATEGWKPKELHQKCFGFLYLPFALHTKSRNLEWDEYQTVFWVWYDHSITKIWCGKRKRRNRTNYLKRKKGNNFRISYATLIPFTHESFLRLLPSYALLRAIPNKFRHAVRGEKELVSDWAKEEQRNRRIGRRALSPSTAA
jgi:hypothetical protein